MRSERILLGAPRNTKLTHKRSEGGRLLDKTLFFLFTAIPIASDRQAVAQGAQSDSNKSTLLPIYKTNLSDNNKEEWRSRRKKQGEQRLATVNILEKLHN